MVGFLYRIKLIFVSQGFDWTLLDSVYLQNVHRKLEVQKWRDFFTRLGVTDSVSVRSRRVEITQDVLVRYVY